MFDAMDYWLMGKNLSDAEAQLLETRLQKRSSNMKARCKLIGYYSRKQYTDDECREKFEQHALWIIENHPKHEIHDHPLARLDRVSNHDAYEKAKRIWIEHLELETNNSIILEHAASFFILEDKKLAQSLYKNLQSLDPKNPEWTHRLAHAYDLDKQHKNALIEQEKACRLIPTSTYELENLATYAIRADEFEKAKRAANQMIDLASKESEEYRTPRILQTANTILGLISVRQGDVDAAKIYLSSACPDVPEYATSVNWFSREARQLLQGLLDNGESESVIRYLLHSQRCRQQKPCIDRWIGEIKDELVPDMDDDQPFFNPAASEREYVSAERFWHNQLVSLNIPNLNQGPLRYSSLWQLLITMTERSRPSNWTQVVEALRTVPIVAQRQFAKWANSPFLVNLPVSATCKGFVHATENETLRVVCVWYKDLTEGTLRDFMRGSVTMLRSPETCLYSDRARQEAETVSPKPIDNGPYLVLGIDLIGNKHLCDLVLLDETL